MNASLCCCKTRLICFLFTLVLVCPINSKTSLFASVYRFRTRQFLPITSPRPTRFGASERGPDFLSKAEEVLSCGVRARGLVPERPARILILILILMESSGVPRTGRDRAEHEQAEWKCTRGPLRLTWTSANKSTDRWHQPSPVIQWESLFGQTVQSRKFRKK